MPQSKKRPHHHHQQVSSAHRTNRKSNHAIIYVSTIFFALLGAGISYFATGPDPVWLSAGAIVGALAGYLFGYQIDRSIANK